MQIRSSRAAQAKLARLYFRNKDKRTGSVAEVVEHLPNKYKALYSIPGSVKREKYICVYISIHTYV
jgi:hypothetical protein